MKLDRGSKIEAGCHKQGLSQTFYSGMVLWCQGVSFSTLTAAIPDVAVLPLSGAWYAVNTAEWELEIQEPENLMRQKLSQHQNIFRNKTFEICFSQYK